MFLHIRGFAAFAVILCLAFFLPQLAHAQVTIDNGVVGDGFWEVVVDDGGDSTDGTIDPTGAMGPTDIIFEFFTYADVGADGGGVTLGSTTVTAPAALTGPGEVTSAGNFAGANATINWTSVASIAPGSLIYQNDLNFSSTAPFGTVRIICYLDEDVLGAIDDVLVLFGTPGAADFNLLTIDDDNNVGVAHSAGFLSATNATYIGWAADEFSDLRTAITGTGATYSIPGVIDTVDLPPFADPRFPGQSAFGPEDITAAFAFDLAPAATSADITCSLGGAPSGQPPGQGPGLPPPAAVPTLSPTGILALILLLVFIGSVALRRAALR